MKKIMLILFVVVWAAGIRYFIDHPHLRQKLLAMARPVTVAEMPSVFTEVAPQAQMLPGRAFPPVDGASNWEQQTASENGPCVSPPTMAVMPAPQTRIYRWTDARGETAFGDRPPANVIATLYDPQAPERPQYFVLKIDHIGRRQVPYIQAQLQANTTSIYEVLRDLLGPERLRQVSLNIKLFENRQDYRQYASQTASAHTANAGGFYSLNANEAVTYQQQNDRETLAVLRHEAVHVIIGGLLGGTTPLWLNEGLAEYFTRMESGGQYAHVLPNETWLELARHAISSGFPRRLADLLAMDGETWYGNGQQTHYALGWSLVYFLMDSPKGRRALASLLQAKAGNYCAPVDQTRWLARSYPGGAAALQREFYSWIQDSSPKERHRY